MHNAASTQVDPLQPRDLLDRDPRSLVGRAADFRRQLAADDSGLEDQANAQQEAA
jgi:hypothetical protein